MAATNELTAAAKKEIIVIGAGGFSYHLEGLSMEWISSFCIFGCNRRCRLDDSLEVAAARDLPSRNCLRGVTQRSQDDQVYKSVGGTLLRYFCSLTLELLDSARVHTMFIILSMRQISTVSILWLIPWALTKGTLLIPDNDRTRRRDLQRHVGIIFLGE